MLLRRIFVLLLVAGSSTCLLAQSKSVAITVDDLPYQSGYGGRPLSPSDTALAAEVNRRILDALARNNVPATGFVNELKVEQLGTEASKTMLKPWTAGNFALGNHLYSHKDANGLTTKQIEEEIVRGEATIVPLMKAAGKPTDFLRFPFNHTGDTQAKHDAIAAFMAQRGYRLAPCTIENQDWEFNRAYVLMLTKHDDDSAARLRAEYLAFTAAAIDYYSALNKQVLGYNPPEIMLLHANRLNADVLDQVLSIFEEKHYRFVSLSQAESDPIYQQPDTYITQHGPMWGYRWAKERKVSLTSDRKINVSLEPEPPAWITEYGQPK